MSQRSDEELEDYRVETLQRRAERDRQRRSHAYDPTCGCEECEPEPDEDDDAVDEDDE